VLNPELTGLADEGAYLLMAKQVLPAGMLGLMLGLGIFSTGIILSMLSFIALTGKGFVLSMGLIVSIIGAIIIIKGIINKRKYP